MGENKEELKNNANVEKEQAKENNMEKVDEIIELKKNVASMKAEMEEKDDIRGCIRCELIEMDWCTLRIRKYVTSQNTFVHGKENFNENTGACHWSGRVRIDGCDICRPRRMQGAYS